MKLLADSTGEQIMVILEQSNDAVKVQFISEQGVLKGKPFQDSLSGLLISGWSHRATSTAIGLERFKQGILEDATVSYALHQLFPLGRKIKLQSNQIATIASYANTHSDGYYMYLSVNDELKRLKVDTSWEVMPSEKLLALPYYPAPKTKAEIENIAQFDAWAGGF